MSTDFSTGEGVNGGGLAGQAQERAQSLAEQARARAREQVGQRSSDLAARASTVAGDLQVVAQSFRSQGRDAPASLAEHAAQRVSGAAQYLEGNTGERLLRDAEGVARQRPWMAVTGGVAVGLIASRVLKASSTERYRSGYAGPNTPERLHEATSVGRETGGARSAQAAHAEYPSISPVQG